MDKKTYLRLSYWFGAIGDALLGIEMFFSAFLGNLSPFNGLGFTINGGSDYRYAMAIGATFMLSWTILLLWADRKPFEKKDLLLILIPVIIGLQSSMILGFTLGLISIEKLLIDGIQRLAYGILIVFSYFKASKTID